MACLSMAPTLQVPNAAQLEPGAQPCAKAGIRIVTALKSRVVIGDRRNRAPRAKIGRQFRPGNLSGRDDARKTVFTIDGIDRSISNGISRIDSLIDPMQGGTKKVEILLVQRPNAPSSAIAWIDARMDIYDLRTEPLKLRS